MQWFRTSSGRQSFRRHWCCYLRAKGRCNHGTLDFSLLRQMFAGVPMMDWTGFQKSETQSVVKRDRRYPYSTKRCTELKQRRPNASDFAPSRSGCCGVTCSSLNATGIVSDRLAASLDRKNDDVSDRSGLSGSSETMIEDRALRSARCGRVHSVGWWYGRGAPLASFPPLSIVTAVQRRPASLRATVVNTCESIRLSALRIVTVTPSSGHQPRCRQSIRTSCDGLARSLGVIRLQRPFIAE
jgi:hypothetical protein